MAEPIVSDELWELIEPLLPPAKPRRFRSPGRKPMEPRKVLTGILFVLRTGIPWEMLPQEMGCGCGMTCWNHLTKWQREGVWQKLHHVLLEKLQEADKIDWSRAAVDSTHARALGGGEKTGKNPTDRGKPGVKHHIATDANGLPLAVLATGSNVHDVTMLLPLVDAIPEVIGAVGRPRRRPTELFADTAYDSRRHRTELRRRGIRPRIPHRNRERGSGRGIYRRAVERTPSWLHNFRKLRLRTERRDDVHKAFLSLAAAVICSWFM